VAHESGVDTGLAERLTAIGQRLRALQAQGLGDGVSTRALVHAGLLATRGIAPRRACTVALADVLGDDPELAAAARDVIDVLLP
jgi:nitric oxide reductase NorQ protein